MANIKIMIDEKSVIGVDLSKHGKYSYASIAANINDKQYIRVSYEWEDDFVPDVVMDIMKFVVKNDKKEIASLDSTKEEFKDLINRFTSVNV